MSSATPPRLTVGTIARPRVVQVLLASGFAGRDASRGARRSTPSSHRGRPYNFGSRRSPPVIHEEAGLPSRSRAVGCWAPRRWRRLGLWRRRSSHIRPRGAGQSAMRGSGAQSSAAAVPCWRGQTFMRARPSGAERWSGAGGAFKRSTSAHRAAVTGRALAGPGAFRQRSRRRAGRSNRE
jgi:hypothetical protein